MPSVCDPHGQDVFLIYEAAGIMILDDRGTLLAEHNWPPPGHQVHRQRQTPRPQRTRSVTDSLTHQLSPMS